MGFMFCDLHVSFKYNPSSGDINSSNLPCECNFHKSFNKMLTTCQEGTLSVQQHTKRALLRGLVNVLHYNYLFSSPIYFNSLIFEITARRPMEALP